MILTRPKFRSAVGQSIYFEIRDAATPFLPKSGLAFNTANLVASYCLTRGARVAITLATQTVTGAWVSGGFVEVDATNMPGVYRLDLPNAALANDGISDAVIVTLEGATGYAATSVIVPLTDMKDVFVGTGTTRADS